MTSVDFGRGVCLMNKKYNENAGEMFDQGSCVHFWRGNHPLAFVFSVPGRLEIQACRPVSGVTGENLEMALAHLNKMMPHLFPSPDRYAYRIANAYRHPMAKALGHRKTEASAKQILHSENIARVISEINGCDLVVLCGKNAKLLSAHLCSSGRHIFEMCHTSNQALARCYRVASHSHEMTGRSRREVRVKMWAMELVEKLLDVSGHS